jgi:hypothetical protein
MDLFGRRTRWVALIFGRRIFDLISPAISSLTPATPLALMPPLCLSRRTAVAGGGNERIVTKA